MIYFPVSLHGIAYKINVIIHVYMHISVIGDTFSSLAGVAFLWSLDSDSYAADAYGVVRYFRYLFIIIFLVLVQV